MKKIVCILISMLLVISSALAAGMPEGFISTSDFNLNFNMACINAGSNHRITNDNIIIAGGDWRDCFRIVLLDNVLEMHLYIPHSEVYTGETEDINEISLLFISDGKTESVANFILAIIEVAYATGGVENTDEAKEFINELGILDNIVDGANNTITRGDLKYSYSLSTSLGIISFSVLKI